MSLLTLQLPIVMPANNKKPLNDSLEAYYTTMDCFGS
jgi:hypothetical protein